MNEITHPHRRRLFSEKLYAHFITTSCHDQRKFFSIERAVEIFQWALTSQAEKHNAHLIGYVIMPEHVHFIIWFPESGQLSNFMKHLKQRSSKWIRKEMGDDIVDKWGVRAIDDPLWQTRYYSFEIESEEKLNEKLNYIHQNPVRKEFCKTATDWEWSSASYYETGEQRRVNVSRP